MFEDMTLTVDLPFAGYVYVVGFNYTQGSVTYFPTEYLATEHKNLDSGRMNYFPAGTHELPGTIDGKPQRWWVPDVAETVQPLCRREPQPDRGIWRRLCHSPRADGPIPPFPITRWAITCRGRARTRSSVGSPCRTPRCRPAQNQMDSVAPGPMVPWAEHEGVYLKVFNIQPTQNPGKQTPDPFQRRLLEAIRKKETEGKSSGSPRVSAEVVGFLGVGEASEPSFIGAFACPPRPGGAAS